MTTTEDAAQLNPDTFDLDAWLAGVTRTQAVVTLNARQDLATRIDELVEQIRGIDERLRDRGKVEKSPTEAGDGAVVDVDERDAAQTQLRQLWAEFEGSGVDFELTQMSSAEYDAALDKVNEQHPEPAFDAPDAERARVRAEREALGSDLIVLGSVTAYGLHGKPRTTSSLTWDQLRTMQQRFGIRQYAELVGEARALTLVHQEIDAPFSQRVSDALTEHTFDS